MEVRVGRARGTGVARRIGGVGVALCSIVGVVATFTVGAGVPASAVTPNVLGARARVASGIDHPVAMVPGPDGNVWFAAAGNDAIGRVEPDGDTTVLWSWMASDPSAITVGPGGALWFTSRERSEVSRVTTAGVFETVASVSGDARLEGIAAGSDGNVWVTDEAGSAIDRVTPAGAVTEFPTSVAPHGIVAGPDGNLWFTSKDGDAVGKMTTAGVATTYAGSSVSGPTSITVGPGGHLWFANDDGSIGRVTTAGSLTSFPAVPMYSVTSVTNGPDGNLWFATQAVGTVGRMTAAGSASLFTRPGSTSLAAITAGSDGRLWFGEDYAVAAVTTSGTFSGAYVGSSIGSPQGITTGPDGKIWFTSRKTSSIGRLEADGSVTSFTSPLVDGPEKIVAGADGNLWFTNLHGASIGRITPTGTISRFTTAGLSAPTGIDRGPDGNVWFTDLFANRIGRITPSGTITLFADAGISGPKDIVAGPDGNLWFTSSYAGAIGRITPSGTVTAFTDAVHIHQPSGIGVGPDRSLWFVDGQKVGRITTAGVASWVGNSQGFGDGDLVAGPDGGAWVAQHGDDLTRVPYDGETVSYLFPEVDRPTAVTIGPDGNVWFANDGSSIARADLKRTVPEAPKSVTATVDYRSAVVSWMPPAYTGGTPITGYTVLVNGELAQARCVNTTATSCRIDGLQGNYQYEFWVQAHNASGSGAYGQSNLVRPFIGAGYHPLEPTRVLDTRGLTTLYGGPGRLTAGTPRTLPLRISGGAVPWWATAVVMNVTATESDSPSFLTVYPSGTPKPNASNLNFSPGQDVPNLVTVKLGDDGGVNLATAVGSTHVVVDVVGYYDDGGPYDGGLFNAVAPRRLLDSRTSTGGWPGKLGEGVVRDLAVRQPANPNGVPATATAVVANITVTGSNAQSVLRTWPSGGSFPSVSNLNFLPGQTVPNLAIVKIGANGAISFFNDVGSAHVIVDVVGYYDESSGSPFFPLVPTRVLDSRIGNGLTGPWQPQQSRALSIGGRAGTGVPAAATGVVTNITVTDGTAESLLTVYPGNVAKPNASNLNFGAGQIVPNLAAVGLAPDGSVKIYNDQGTVNVVADVVGFFAPT